MAVDKLKVMLSFMREINDGNNPQADDYDISNSEFWDVIDACQDAKYIGSKVFAGRSGQPYTYVLYGRRKIDSKRS